MGKCFVLAFMISLAMLFSGTAFAASLNITSNAVALPAQSNLSSNVTMLNLMVIHDADYLNLTYINFTFNSTSSGANGSTTGIGVCVFNRTLAEPLNCSYNWSFNQTNVTFGLNMTNNTNYTLLVTYSILPNATNPTNISVFISSNTSIGTNATSNTLNISNSIFPLSSNFTIIRIASASASITPRYVDTNVTNQNFIYNITTGPDPIYGLVINTSPGYNITDVVNVTVDGVQCYPSAGGCTAVNFSNQINITFVGGRTGTILVNFTANTSSTSINSTAFNSTINGTNIHFINTTPASAGSTNVTTKMLVNITNITSVKNVAFVNGTDYWEFNFTVNITEAVYGMIQFKMNNWTSASTGYNITLQNATSGNITYYATMRNASESISTSNKLNVTNDYNITQGVFMNTTAAGTHSMSLRMVIPSGTQILSDWWTTYKILFRTQP